MRPRPLTPRPASPPLSLASPRLTGACSRPVEHFFLILLFTLYLLLGGDSAADADADGSSALADERDGLSVQVDAQIRRFIKGKVLLSLLVGVSTVVILRLLQVDLSLGFGLLAFWLNFIPNVGALIAVSAPMPLVRTRCPLLPPFALSRLSLHAPPPRGRSSSRRPLAWVAWR